MDDNAEQVDWSAWAPAYAPPVISPLVPVTGLGAPGENHMRACKRTKARKGWDLLPPHYIEALEQNQKIASCCRHPENHDVEAWYSSADDAAKGVPDIYKFICTCGRTHARFCVGGGDVRPVWDIR